MKTTVKLSKIKTRIQELIEIIENSKNKKEINKLSDNIKANTDDILFSLFAIKCEIYSIKEKKEKRKASMFINRLIETSFQESKKLTKEKFTGWKFNDVLPSCKDCFFNDHLPVCIDCANKRPCKDCTNKRLLEVKKAKDIIKSTKCNCKRQYDIEECICIVGKAKFTVDQFNYKFTKNKKG